MTDLDRIEALVGPLPRGRKYEKWRLNIHRDPIMEVERADAALAEAYAVIERQAKEDAGWERSHKVWCDDLANIDSLKQRAEKAEVKLAALRDADAVIPLSEDQAGAFRALSESIKSEQRLGAEVARLDAALRSACRKWAACCTLGVLYPPLIGNAGEGLRLLIDEQPDLAARYEAGHK